MPHCPCYPAHPSICTGTHALPPPQAPALVHAVHPWQDCCLDECGRDRFVATKMKLKLAVNRILHEQRKRQDRPPLNPPRRYALLFPRE